MLKLKLQYFGHLMWRADSLEKTLMLGKIEGRGRRGQHGMRWLMASPTQWTRVWANSGKWWKTGKPGAPQCIGSQGVRQTWGTEQQQQQQLLFAGVKLGPGGTMWTLSAVASEGDRRINRWQWCKMRSAGEVWRMGHGNLETLWGAVKAPGRGGFCSVLENR